MRVKWFAAASAVAFVLTAQAEMPITYRLEKEGRVSLAIYDAQGAQVRTLMSAVPQSAGEHTILWDERNREGLPVAPGDYSWRLLSSQGLKAEYLLSLGTSFGENAWLGNHRGPCALAQIDDKGFVVASARAEKAAMYARMTCEGDVKWRLGPFNDHKPLTDLAYDNGVVYCLAKGQIIEMNAETSQAITHKDKGLTMYERVAAFAFGAGGPAAKEGWKNVGLEPYNEKRGYGWEDPQGIQIQGGGASPEDSYHVFETGSLAQERDRRFFKATSVPDGDYLVNIHIRDSAKHNNFYFTSGVHFGNKPMFARIVDVQRRGGVTIYTVGAQVRIPKKPLYLGFNNDGEKKQAQAGWAVCAVELHAPITRVDAFNGRMAVALPGPVGKIQVFNTPRPITPDAPAPLLHATVTDLQDVALTQSGDPLVISGNRIVRYFSGGHKTVVENLESPKYISVDKITGRIYVAEWGKSHQVKVFSPEFALLNTFGQKGGRKFGAYDAQNYHQIADICGDGKGGYVVAEEWSPPRRVAHFDENGRLTQEWYGGQQFFTDVAVDPKDSTLVWFGSHFKTLVEAKVDYGKRNWSPKATYNHIESMNAVLHTQNNFLEPYQVVYHGNEKWLYSGRHSACLLRVDEAAGVLRPLAMAVSRLTPSNVTSAHRDALTAYLAACGLKRSDIGAGNPDQAATETNEAEAEETEERAEQHGEVDGQNEQAAGGGGKRRGQIPKKWADCYSWADLNLDGKMQAGEIILDRESRPGGQFKGLAMDTAFNVYQPLTLNEILPPFVYRAQDVLKAQKSGASYTDLRKPPSPDYSQAPLWLVMKPQGFTAAGIPIWDMNKRIEGPMAGTIGYARNVNVDSQGDIYAILHGGGDGFRAQIDSEEAHGPKWPSNKKDGVGFAKWSKDGRLLFKVASLAVMYENCRPGQMFSPMRVSGFVKGCVGVGDRINQPLEVWTQDGLYVGGLFDRRANDGLPGRVYVWNQMNNKNKGYIGWREENNHRLNDIRPWGDEDNRFYEEQQAPLQYDMERGGQLVERENGDVLFFGVGWNNVPIYRVHGWNEFERHQGGLKVSRTNRAAPSAGTGLQAEYYSGEGFEGAAHKRVDSVLWFGKQGKYIQPWPEVSATARKPFAVRWTGMIEPRFSEEYRFYIYGGVHQIKGERGLPAKGNLPQKVRIWVGDQLLLDAWEWNERYYRTDSAGVNVADPRMASDLIALKAGKRVPVKIEYVALAGTDLHFCWESPSQSIEHVPSTCLYSHAETTASQGTR